MNYLIKMIISPEWFVGYDVILEFIFAVITLIVALFGFKIYKETSQRQPFYLAWGFILISISYLLQSILNILILTELNKNICGAIRIQSVTTFNIIGVYMHMFFMIIGLAVLTFMTLKSKDIRELIVITGLALLAVFLSINPLYMFYTISSLLLIVISYYFINNFLKNKKNNTLLIAIAFLFLLFGSIHFFFAVDHELFYVLGHILELIAYILVLSNLFMVLKR